MVVGLPDMVVVGMCLVAAAVVQIGTANEDYAYLLSPHADKAAHMVRG